MATTVSLLAPNLSIGAPETLVAALASSFNYSGVKETNTPLVKHIPDAGTLATPPAGTSSYTFLYSIFILGLLYYTFEAVATFQNASKNVEVPVVGWGRWTAFVPRVLLNLVFAGKAAKTLEDGYQRFKDRAFQLVRNEGAMVILPQQLLDELSHISDKVASPHGALEHDLLGDYTGLNLILESRMHHSIVQRKLTPRLGLLTPGLEEQLVKAVNEYLPSCDTEEWTEFMPYQVFGKISARLAARALVGPNLCENPEWLDISVNYTESLFRTIVILRLVPWWIRPVICHLLPSYWAGKAYVRKGKKLLAPIIKELLAKKDAGNWSPAANAEESNVMYWLAESAKGKDRDAEKLAHVEVLLALASVHTTLLRMVNVLFDVTGSPEFFDPLIQEIDSVQQLPEPWTNASYQKLDKLDSCMRESQRMSPPTTLGLKRMFKQDYTFANGMHVKKGTYVCMPIYAIENDISHPETFDGLRSWRKRQAQQNAPKLREASDENLFSSITPTTLNFGYGKTACPGRFFASLIIKMLFVKLLPEYEFKFNDGKSRPQNLMAHEFLFCWPWEKMQVRRRRDGASPLS
ncbi:putative cytochrome P450 [Polyplosphaeria fusca]|uniref:Cytochrome P450 n=1 Tax=Polyplosphaeria fusca TaxID=682080 RepID=A0A9P4QKC1_9PLEO|nr:putative cytochrome P450 [Polyplosphaeria fusca]